MKFLSFGSITNAGFLVSKIMTERKQRNLYLPVRVCSRRYSVCDDRIGGEKLVCGVVGER